MLLNPGSSPPRNSKKISQHNLNDIQNGFDLEFFYFNINLKNVFMMTKSKEKRWGGGSKQKNQKKKKKVARVCTWQKVEDSCSNLPSEKIFCQFYPIIIYQVRGFFPNFLTIKSVWEWSSQTVIYINKPGVDQPSAHQVVYLKKLSQIDNEIYKVGATIVAKHAHLELSKLIFRPFVLTRVVAVRGEGGVP